MAYRGPERRVRTCFVTRHREYHFKSGVCVAVRDRASSAWIADHEAVGLRLVPPLPGGDYLGRPLDLIRKTLYVRTSEVVDILRPNRTTAAAYSLVSAMSPSRSSLAPCSSRLDSSSP